MPSYVITAPDGRKFRVTGDGTKEEALAEFQAQYQAKTPRETPAPQKTDPTADMSTTDKLLAGAGKAFVDMGRGMHQYSAELGNVMGLGRLSPANFGDERIAQLRQEAADRRAVDQPLMDTAAGFTGNILGNTAAMAPAMAVPGANTAAGAGVIGAAQAGMMQPVVNDQERGMNTALGFGLGAAGQKYGGDVADWAGNKLTQRAAGAATAKAQNAVRDQTIREGLDAGFVVPPTTTNPSAKNRILESISGKVGTQQAASESNQSVTNALVREDLGLAPDAPLTRDTFSFVRKQAGQVYDQVKKSGQIAADYQYMTDIADLVGQNSAMTRAFPGAAQVDDEVVKLANKLAQQQFDAEGAVEMVKRLRADSKANFKATAMSGDPGKRQLAQAQWDAAGALEDQIERHLQSIGQPDLMQTFREARQLIAKSHSAELALNEGTGNIRASKLVQQLSKRVPLSGNFEKIAKFASAAPKATAEPTQSGGVNALTAMLAGGGAALGAPHLLALPAARYATRKAILTPAVQRRIALSNYRPSRTGTSALRGMQGLGQAAAPLALGSYASEQ